MMCSFPGCEKPMKVRGFCNGHYCQLLEGRPMAKLYGKSRPYGTLPVIVCDESPCNVSGLGCCHVFRGRKTVSGYGVFKSRGKHILVHRYVYENEVDKIPSGLVIDHICRNPPCCNPDHLRAVTQKINSTENVVGSGPQINAAKTHCPQGHPYSEENTYHSKKDRHCRQCHRDRQKRYREIKNLAS